MEDVRVNYRNSVSYNNSPAPASRGLYGHNDHDMISRLVMGGIAATAANADVLMIQVVTLTFIIDASDMSTVMTPVLDGVVCVTVDATPSNSDADEYLLTH